MTSDASVTTDQGGAHPRERFVSLGTKLRLSSAALVLLVAAPVYVGLSSYEREELLAAKDRTARALVHLFAASLTAPLAFGDHEGIAEAVRNLAQNPDVLRVEVWLPDANDEKKRGSVVGRFSRGSVRAPDAGATRDALPSAERLTRREDYLLIEAPVTEPQQPTVSGGFRVAVSLARENSRIRSIERRVLAASALTATVFWLLLGVLARQLIIRPLKSLSDAAGALEAGKHVRLAVMANDEVGGLALRFQSMADAVSVREQRIKTQNRDMRLVLDNVRQGILTVDRSGRLAEERSKALDLWFGPPEQGADILEYFGSIDEQLAHEFRSGWEAVLQDHRLLEQVLPSRFTKADKFFELTYCPIIEEGNLQKALVVIDDITRRVRREQAELEHRQLMERYHRQAGMAEIATSVLHNVGNALNSVNVSAVLIADNLKKSKLSGLGKAVALIREHEHSLGDFLRNDSRGKRLPSYLAQLSEHLLAEQESMIRELLELREKIEHINEIVATQQAFAGGASVVEDVDLRMLIEQALRMNEESLGRHGIETRIETEELPRVRLDKHKTLQILVHLIRNAEQACIDSARGGGQVALSGTRLEHRIEVSVKDTGVGIAAENLTRIFQQGFTTRSEGHGSGLHSSALAAKEMGGSLRAHSEGPGRGATFVLELPLELAASPTS